MLSLFSLIDGEQLFLKNIAGDGPFEIRNPARLQITDNRIDIINRSGKIISFDFEGNELFEAQTNLQFVKDFYMIDDQVLATTDSPANSYLTYLFNAENYSMEPIKIPQRIENLLMAPFNESGTITSYGNYIYVAEPHGSKVHQLDKNSIEVVKSIELIIPNFKVISADNPLNAYFDNMDLLNDFLSQNSMITTIDRINNNFLMEVFHAHQNFSGRELLILDDYLTVLCIMDFSDDLFGVQNPKIHAVANDLIYFYREEVDASSLDVSVILSAFSAKCK